MLSFLGFLVTLVTLCLIAMQVVYVLGYQAWIESEDKLPSEGALLQTAGDEVVETAVYQPPAAIVLCLKGDDENLSECLVGLISQDYADYRLVIVVDSERDPVVGSVAQFFAGVKFKPDIQALRTPKSTCSLKCSAITQAILSVPSRYEVIALIDGDTIPDQSWLSELVAPLADKTIGATTGNRWYSPTSNAFGTWVRKIWNAAAIVQMQRYHIPWGGSLAIRAETIERCGLVDHWRRSFCEDTAMVSPLKKHKLKIHRVPNLVLENTESVSLAGAFEWISRQLLTVRLHHPKWSLVLAHAFASGVVGIGAPILIVLMLWTGQTRGLWTLLQSFVAWQLVNSVLLYLIERSNRQAIEQRDSFNRLPVPQSPSFLMQFGSTLLTQWIYPFAAWQASAMEKVDWRGVTYKIRGNGTVELVDKSDVASSARTSTASGIDLLSYETAANSDVTEKDSALDEDKSGNVYLPSRFSKRSRN